MHFKQIFPLAHFSQKETDGGRVVPNADHREGEKTVHRPQFAVLCIFRFCVIFSKIVGSQRRSYTKQPTA